MFGLPNKKVSNGLLHFKEKSFVRLHVTKPAAKGCFAYIDVFETLKQFQVF